MPRRASCPHAASMSAPRERRTEGVTPAFSSAMMNDSRRVEELPAVRALGGVVLDEVHVEAAVADEGRETAGVGGGVVDAVEQQVLDEDPATSGVAVPAARGKQVGDRPPVVDRHELRTGVVVRRVKRHGQANRERMMRQLGDPRHPAGRRDRDLARGQAQTVRVADSPAGLQDCGEVLEGLAHPHEDHIRDVGRVPLGRGRGERHLVHDLLVREVAPRAEPCRRAEPAPQRATHLARHADRPTPARVRDRHGLDPGAVARPERPLHGPVAGGRVRLRHHCPQVERLAHELAERPRPARDAVPVRRAAPLRLGGLPGAVRRLAEFRQKCLELAVHGPAADGIAFGLATKTVQDGFSDPSSRMRPDGRSAVSWRLNQTPRRIRGTAARRSSARVR